MAISFGQILVLISTLTGIACTLNEDNRYPSIITKPKIICPGEGYFPHPRNCSWFYRCEDIMEINKPTPTFYQCPRGTSFVALPTKGQERALGICIPGVEANRSCGVPNLGPKNKCQVKKPPGKALCYPGAPCNGQYANGLCHYPAVVCGLHTEDEGVVLRYCSVYMTPNAGSDICTAEVAGLCEANNLIEIRSASSTWNTA